MNSQEHFSQPPPDDPVNETQQIGNQPSGSRRKSPSRRAKSGSRWIGIGLAVAVIGGVTAAVISLTTTGNPATVTAGNSPVPGSSSAATGSSNGVAAPKGGTSTAKGKVISAAKLAANGGALRPSTGKQTSIVRWQSGAGGHDLSAVSNRLGQSLQAGGIKQYASMRFACTQLASSVATAKAGPAIPDAAMQQLYATALSDLAKGAADCRAAISVKSTGEETTQANVDAAKLRQSTAELSAGSKSIFRATAEIQILARQHH